MTCEKKVCRLTAQSMCAIRRMPESACCDYCIVGDQNPLTKVFELVKQENGLLVSCEEGKMRDERICYR